MGTTLTASFASRREAEMTVERLVQEHGVERTDIFIVPAGAENSVGVARDGSDCNAGGPSPEIRDDSPLNGAVAVSVDIEDDNLIEQVRQTFGEFEASDVEQS